MLFLGSADKVRTAPGGFSRKALSSPKNDRCFQYAYFDMCTLAAIIYTGYWKGLGKYRRFFILFLLFTQARNYL